MTGCSAGSSQTTNIPIPTKYLGRSNFTPPGKAGASRRGHRELPRQTGRSKDHYVFVCGERTAT